MLPEHLGVLFHLILHGPLALAMLLLFAATWDYRSTKIHPKGILTAALASLVCSTIGYTILGFFILIVNPIGLLIEVFMLAVVVFTVGTLLHREASYHPRGLHVALALNFSISLLCGLMTIGMILE